MLLSDRLIRLNQKRNVKNLNCNWLNGDRNYKRIIKCWLQREHFLKWYRFLNLIIYAQFLVRYLFLYYIFFEPNLKCSSRGAGCVENGNGHSKWNNDELPKLSVWKWKEFYFCHRDNNHKATKTFIFLWNCYQEAKNIFS